MMMDIFSTSDSNNMVFFQQSWILWLLSVYLILSQSYIFWVNSPWMVISNNLKSIIVSLASRSFGASFKGFTIIITSLFLFLMMTNLTGMIPYTFSSSSHLMLSLSMSLTFWLSLIILGLKKSPKKMIAHLLPVGSPGILSPFLAVVELISIMVRPVTLAIRLTANMGAGHIILGLIGTYLSSYIFSSWIFLLLILIQMGYFLFEFGVSLIQAYIFSLLITLYSDDLAC
uniref:ATP synthase subunit a n=1 Tax=Scutopus ventrolineatus TaxID=52922 RepID=A0A096XEB2_SCUVE|nr:ATP synthase F0 subunit 6 [Scutopus ventrolineatus]AHI45696.1 ATP synthase F0 subunit 6 [Scutopus ventrolineatus]